MRNLSTDAPACYSSGANHHEKDRHSERHIRVPFPLVEPDLRIIAYLVGRGARQPRSLRGSLDHYHLYEYYIPARPSDINQVTL